MIFFDNVKLEYVERLVPKGRANRKAIERGSNYNKIIQWIASIYSYIISHINDIFKGVYICESDILIDMHKKDLSIPDAIFINSDTSEHRKDVYVRKFLMGGNSRGNFVKIAKIYGYDIDIVDLYTANSYSNFVYKLPIKSLGCSYCAKHTVKILVRQEFKDSFVYNLPLRFGIHKKFAKIISVFEEIKSSEVKIIYSHDDTVKEIEDTTCLKNLTN